MSAKDLQELVPWAFPVGVELTWQPEDYHKLEKKGDLDSTLEQISDEFDDMARKAGLKASKGSADRYGDRAISHADCTHCVEYPTPVLKSWKKFHKIYDQASEIAHKLKMKPSIDGATTGMGHIHVGKLSYAEKLYAMRDMVSRPYVSWALVHPSDDINARPLAADISINGATYGFSRYEGHSNRIGMLWKQFALRHSTEFDTLEWRAFDAPEDWKEQVRQMALVQRYFTWVRAQVAAGRTAPLPFTKATSAHEYLRGWDFDTAKEGWQEFIEMLGLPYDEYSYWVDQNMEPRFEWGNRF